MVSVAPDGVCRWRLEPVGAMRVPGVVFAHRGPAAGRAGGSGVAAGGERGDTARCRRGVVRHAGRPLGIRVPDRRGGGHRPGPRRGDLPGGVGFDISCGVRLLTSTITRADAAAHPKRLMDLLGAATPRGMGRGGVLPATGQAELDEILAGGSAYAVRRGFGVPADLVFCEDGGAVAGADPGAVGARALERGRGQVGSLGSGNHFLEVQAIDRIYDERVARTVGLRPDLLCLMIQCGVAGLGHQICSDHVRVMSAMNRYGIQVPDPQLACAPVASPESRRYLGAMAAAANYGRANRQLLTNEARRCFRDAGLGRVS